MYPDYLIKNGMIVDGTGRSAYKADLSVHNGRIERIEDRLDIPDGYPKERVIDADGSYVTPGFVDIHRHGDWLALINGDDELLNRQGITTVVNGNCGLSIAPAGTKYRDEILGFLRAVVGDVPTKDGISFSSSVESMSGYFKALDQTKRSVNTGMLVGNGTLRAAAAGYSDGTLHSEELQKVRDLLKESIDAGALGVSIGLAYAPEFLYRKETMIEALEPIRETGIPLIAHIRNEGNGLLESVREMLEVADALSLPLHISHMKCIGRRNWNTVPKEVLSLIENARAKGRKVDYDLYPYVTGSTQLVHLLPPEFQEGGTAEIIKRLSDPKIRAEAVRVLAEPSGRFENIVELVGFDKIFVTVLNSEKFQPYAGLSISGIAAKTGCDPYDVLFDILIAEHCAAPMLDTYGTEEDMLLYYRDPYAAVISDSIYPSGGKVHPRVYASFPKFLIDFVYHNKIFSIEAAVRKMTALPCEVLSIDRGVVKEGKAADLCIFRLEKLRAPADFDDPEQFSEGFDYVFVNGEPCVDHDRWLTGSSGKVLKRQNK